MDSVMIPTRLRLIRNGELNHGNPEAHEEEMPNGIPFPDFMTFISFMVNTLGLMADSPGSGGLRL